MNILITLNVLLLEVHKTVLHAIKNNFHQAKMMKGQRNHVIDKVIIQELVKNEKKNLF